MLMFFDEKKYIAIIGDIINSKKIEDRGSVQKKLFAVLNDINKEYKDDLMSKFMITLGDEFQGLLENGENTIEIIEEIEYRMYPVKIRFGIGIGKIKTEIFYDPIGADGPAYYNARNAVEQLKHNSLADVRISSQNEKSDLLLNTIFSLLYTLKNKWTERQREVVYRTYHTGKQWKTAESLDITQSAVQQILKRADYNCYKQTLETLKAYLSEIEVVDNV